MQPTEPAGYTHALPAEHLFPTVVTKCRCSPHFASPVAHLEPALVADLHLEDPQLAARDGGLDQLVPAALIAIGCTGNTAGTRMTTEPVLQGRVAPATVNCILLTGAG